MNKAYFYSWIFAYCMGTLYFDVVSIAIFLGPIILFLGVFGYPILFLRILFYYHKVAYESFDDISMFMDLWCIFSRHKSILLHFNYNYK